MPRKPKETPEEKMDREYREAFLESNAHLLPTHPDWAGEAPQLVLVGIEPEETNDEDTEPDE